MPTTPPSPTISAEELAFSAYQISVQHQTRQPNLYAAVSVCLLIAYISVALRLLARNRMGQPLMADDFWIIGALIPTTAYAAFNFWATKAGLGLHIIRVTNIKMFIQSSVGCMILYPLCLPPVKFSILYLYCRIFPSRTMRYLSIVIALVVGSAALAASVAFGLQCIPLSSLWVGSESKCINLSALSIATGVVNIVTDVLILCLPIRPLLHLQTSTRIKFGLLATFLLGGCVCIISIVRTTVVGQASQMDPSWNNAIGGLWSLIEVYVAIISANLPVLRPLLIKRRSSSTTGSSGQPANSSGYIKSEQSNESRRSKRRHRGPYSVTNNTLQADNEDQIPLQNVTMGTQNHDQRVKSVDFEVQSLRKQSKQEDRWA